MAKTIKAKIIGFEITYRCEGRFELSTVLEGDPVPEKSCTSIYVPMDREAHEVFWTCEYDGFEPVGVEMELCGACQECIDNMNDYERYSIGRLLKES